MSQDQDHSSMSEEDNQMADSQEMEDLSEEQIIATILDLGNQIWGNMGFEEPIQDASVFFRDQFYMQFFMSAFPDSDFSQLVETEDEEEMAANIQALIDMLPQNILMYDLEHIKGEQIVAGNPEHCINLLQLAKEISCMMNSNSNELDPTMGKGEDQDLGSDEEEESGQPDLLAMQQQLELEDQEAQEMQSSGHRRQADASSSEQQSEEQLDQLQDSQGVVDYDQIQVELEQEGGHLQDGSSNSNEEDEDNVEQEVSINLEDAIATAEEINKQGSVEQALQYAQQVAGEGQDHSDQEEYEQEDQELASAEAIAGIVTDGHNEKDGFDEMREEQLHRQRMVRGAEEYGEEESGVYDEEDDMDVNGLRQDLSEQRHLQGEDEDEDLEGEVEGLHMQIHPDLLAAAHKMGVDLDNLDNDQIHELQKLLEQQNIDMDEQEESEAEEEDAQGIDMDASQKSSKQGQSSSSSSGKKKKKKSSSSSSSKSSSSSSKKQQQQEEAQHSSEDEQAYQYLQQEEQFQQEQADNEEEASQAHEEEEEEHQVEDISAQEEEEEEDNKLQFDVDELNEQERQALVAYLQEEYEKNPTTFQIPKEKLQELISAQLNRNGQDEEDYGEEGEQAQDQQSEKDDEDGDEMQQELTEEQHQQLLMMQAQQMQEQQDEDQQDAEEMDEQEDNELNIVGGGQQIEEDDFPTEQEMIDQQLTEEQIQQVLLLKQQQQQMAMQQQSYGQEMGEEDQQDAQHQMQQIYVQGRQQRKRKAAKQSGLSNTGGTSKYAQARGKKNLFSSKQMMSNTQESATDTNPLQRLMKAPLNGKAMVRPGTGKKPKQTQRPQTAKPRQPAQSYKQFIASQSNRVGRSHRQNQAQTQSQSVMKPARKQSAKKRNTVKKSQLNTISHMPQDDQQQALLQQLMAQKQESGVMPMFNEEFLSQLSEEQLQQVIQQQQAVIQQNPHPPISSKSASQLPPRPNKRSRSAKRPQSSGVLNENQQRQARTRAQIYSQNQPVIGSGRRRTSKGSSANREKKASKGKRRKVQPGQGILLNNFFPALESGGHHSAQKPTAEDQFVAQQQAALLAQQEAQNQEQIINEVPPEEEEGESQDIVNSRIQQSSVQAQEQAALEQQTLQLVQALEGMDPAQQQEFLEQLSPEQQEQLLIHQQTLQMQQQQQVDQQLFAVDENGQPIVQEGMVDMQDQQQFQDGVNESGDAELTEEQLVELLKNADQLSPEQQAQLQQILKNRWKKEIKSQKQKQYNNIYSILTENVAKAKVRLAKLADSPAKKTAKQREEDRETMERINRQKKEYENLLKLYSHDQKARTKGREQEQKRIEKQIHREMKLKNIREKKFEEELINQQKSLMYKRNAQQMRLCLKVYQLASNLEKNKLLEEKKVFLENQNAKKTQKKLMVDGIETFYRDKINMLRERIETEKFERKIAQNAQVEALSRMKRELDLSKKKEIHKYLQLLKQEDQKYDFHSSNLNKLESEIVRLYKK